MASFLSCSVTYHYLFIAEGEELLEKGHCALPLPIVGVSLPHLLIRHGEDILAEFFDRYLEVSLKNYLEYKKVMDEHFRKWLEVNRELVSGRPGSFSTMEPERVALGIVSDGGRAGEP